MLNELICYAENKRDEAAENNPDDVAASDIGWAISTASRLLKG